MVKISPTSTPIKNGQHNPLYNRWYRFLFGGIWLFIVVCSLKIEASNLEAKPSMLVDKKKFNLYLDASVSGCTPKVKIHWEPQQPNYVLGVTDAFKVDVKVVRSREKLFQWEELWRWENTRNCGKNDTCIDTINHPIKTPASFMLGQNIIITISSEKNNFNVLRNEVFEGVLTEFSDKLIVRVAPPVFDAPKNSKPHPRARVAVAPCAKVIRARSHVVNLTVSIVRRHPQ